MSSFEADEFLNYVQLDKDVLINKSEYFKYIHSEGWEEIRDQLEEIVEGKEGESFKVKDSDGNEIFKVKKEPYLLGFYHTFEVYAIPQEIKVETSLNPITIEFGEEKRKIKGEKNVEFNAYPGKYQLVGSYTSTFGKIEYKETVRIEPNKEQQSNISMKFPEEVYTIDTQYPEAVLFINGKSTGKSLNDFHTLGPFPEEEVWMYAEWTDEKGEVQRSEEVSQYYQYGGMLTFWFDTEPNEYGEEDAYLEKETETEKVTAGAEEFTDGQAGEYVIDFREAYETALNTGDYSYISNFLEKDSEAADELDDYITEVKGKGFSFDFQTNEVVSVEREENTYYVQTNEKFTFINQEGNETQYVRVKNYTLVNTGDGMRITKIDISETERNGEEG